MNDLVQRVVNAIIRQEGMPADYTNPGNLRGAPWLPGIIPMRNRFWLPAGRNQGVAGIAHVFALHLAQGNTLTDFIAGHPGVYSGYAPCSDHNNSAAYIKNVCEWAQIPDAAVPMWNFL